MDRAWPDDQASASAASAAAPPASAAAPASRRPPAPRGPAPAPASAASVKAAALQVATDHLMMEGDSERAWVGKALRKVHNLILSNSYRIVFILSYRILSYLILSS